MKMLTVPLAIITVVAVLTLFGMIPPILGIPAVLLILLLRDIILMIFGRGLPLSMISTRLRGGILFGVLKRGRNVAVERFDPQAGMVFTKRHGAFNVVDEGLVKMDGVPFALATEDVGFNIPPEYAWLIAELKRRGIKDIREIIDTNEYGQFVGWKDDPRIRDIREKLTKQAYEVLSRPVDLPGLNDLYRYVTEAAHPFRQDANVKIGIAKGAITTADKPRWLLYIGVMVLLVGIGVGILYMFTGGGGGEHTIRIITDNGETTVIPALTFALGKLRR